MSLVLIMNWKLELGLNAEVENPTPKTHSIELPKLGSILFLTVRLHSW